MILVLDLDDTLYDERTFVDSGFAAVSRYLEPILGQPRDVLNRGMQRALAAYGRGHVFDQVLHEYGVADPQASALVGECVDVYRSHVPEIHLRPEVRDLLERLSVAYPLYLVTDGDPDVQGRKIDALKLAPFFRECFRTWSFGREAGKPSLHCFELIRAKEGVAWRDIVYVGDDPSKDFIRLREVGARTVRVLTGRCREDPADAAHEADLRIADVLGLEALIDTGALVTG